MKRADVKAGTIYQAKRDVIVVLSTDVMWRERIAESGRRASERPLRDGEKPDSHAGFPAARRVPATIKNPRYVGDERRMETRQRLQKEAESLPKDQRWDHVLRNPIMEPMIQDPVHKWAWEPTVALPRDLIAPLDEHERQEQEAAARRKAADEERERVVADRRARVAALLDVLPLHGGHQATLVVRGAEVSLEWLEEIATRLRAPLGEDAGMDAKAAHDAIPRGGSVEAMRHAEENVAEYVDFGEVARGRLGQQCQYVSRYVSGVCGWPVLSAGLRFLGDPHYYHGLRIHRDDVDEFVRRIEEHQQSQEGEV
jgi:hypothetical protein